VIRVQFLDMKVNKERWEEEEELLQVELKRVKEWFKHLSEVYNQHSNDLHPGTAAYSARMATAYQMLEHKVQGLVQAISE